MDTLKKNERRISKIKQEILALERFRSGSLTKQYKKPKDKTGAYYQLSYTYKMKSKTEYIKETCVKKTREQIKEYKKFKRLIEELIDLEMESCKIIVRAEL
jgi:hypothetical protein